ncbi:MAG: GAF domain-containing protein [Desulfobacterales bacterium]|nr:GAF domain-containing protein [Desulfobacterales bacterium]
MIKLINRRVITLLLLIIAVGVMAIWYVVHRTDKDMRLALLKQSRISAHALNIEHLLSLAGSEEDLKSLHYHYLKAQLSRIRQATLECRFLYLMGQRANGEVFFFVDSLPENSEDYVSPGMLYGEISELYLQAFDAKQENVVGPVTDRWGTLITALVPVISPQTGNLVAVLGMDINANDWNWKLIKQAFLPFVVIFLFLGLFLTLAAREQALKLLRESEEKHRLFFENAPIGIIHYNRKSEITEVNEVLTATFGSPDEKLVGQNIGKIFDQRVTKEVYKSLNGNPGHFEGELTFFNNKKKYIRSNWIPTINNGELLAGVGIVEDFTDRRRTEVLLKLNRDEFESILSNIQCITYRCALDEYWTMIYMSSHVDQLTGYPPGDFINNAVRTYKSIIYQEDSKEVEQGIFEAIESGKPWEIEYRIHHKDGDIRWVYEKGSAVISEKGRLEYLDGFIVNITERKRAEVALHLNEARLETLLKLAQMTEASLNKITDFALEEAVKLTGSKLGYLAFINEDETELSMYSWSERAMEACAIIHKQLIYPIEETGLWGEAVRQRKPVITNDYVDPNALKKGLPKGYVPIERHMNIPVFDRDKIVAIAGVGNKENAYDDSDVHQLTLLMQGMWRLIQRNRSDEERKKLEIQLRQAQKMEAIGTLAGGIAHDFNNILFPIFGYLEMMLEDVPEGSQLHDYLTEVFSSAKRARDLVKQILTFSRQTEHEKQPLKVQLVIKEVLKLIRSSLPTSIDICQDISRECKLVMADPTQIHQIVMNLITNAYHAMAETGGKLTVNLKEVELTSKELKDPALDSGSYVRLTVADTGPGMDQEIIAHIFDPYFTTKEEGKGTGLGLAVVHGIVKSHGGHILVYSKPGEGTEFQIFLPVIKSRKIAQEIETDLQIQKGTERILLVDDQDLIVNMERQKLERLGYYVTTRTSSTEALSTFRANPDIFDLVITDMTMPNMTGDKLAEEMIKIRPDIPILLCTGFSEVMSKEKAAAIGIKGFLMKPVVMKEQSGMIRKVLDGHKV